MNILQDNLPLYPIFLIILAISGNFLAQLFPCKIQYYFNNSMAAKYLICLVVFLFTIYLPMRKKGTKVTTQLFRGALMFLWFVLIVKMEKISFYILVVFLIIIQLLSSYKDELLEEEKEENKLKIKTLDTKINNLYIVSVVLTLAGVGYYMYLKKGEYKENFNILSFFTGNVECKNN